MISELVNQDRKLRRNHTKITLFKYLLTFYRSDRFVLLILNKLKQNFWHFLPGNDLYSTSIRSDVSVTLSAWQIFPSKINVERSRSHLNNIRKETFTNCKGVNYERLSFSKILLSVFELVQCLFPFARST